MSEVAALCGDGAGAGPPGREEATFWSLQLLLLLLLLLLVLLLLPLLPLLLLLVLFLLLLLQTPAVNGRSCWPLR